MFDYEKTLFDKLFNLEDEHLKLKDKHLWVKKATGLGVTEFFLRIIAWLCTRNNEYRNTSICIVTGPRIELAVGLIARLKGLFLLSNTQITFEDKETVLELNGCGIEAYPSHHLDSMRGLDRVSFIFADEADFLTSESEQQELRSISERYIGKSNPFIVLVSTPNAPGGLFQKIEQEPEDSCIYKRISLGYQVGLEKIYSQAEIEKAKASPSFEREYNLQYLGLVGNVFRIEDIEAATQEYAITEYNDDLVNFPRIQACMGIDPGFGSSNFAITITNFVDGGIRVLHSEHYSRPNHKAMVDLAFELIQKYNVTKTVIDASAPSFIRALKTELGENPQYESKKREEYQWMKVEPIPFQNTHKQMLYHSKFILENKYLHLHPKFDKLLTSLRTAIATDGILDKQQTSFNDILDSFRLVLWLYKVAEETQTNY
jgi:Terminase RNaseH-like domain